MKKDATPGVPWIKYGLTKGDVWNNYQNIIVDETIKRIKLLMATKPENMPITAVDKVKGGFCDPIRVFVKQEPHKQDKIKTGRFRIISVVSMVDELVERVIANLQNETEILLWDMIPSKPGMGVSLDTQTSLLYESLSPLLTEAAEADITAWDWSIDGWMIDMDARARLFLAGHISDPYSFEPDGVTNLYLNRFDCFSHAVFSLSDGTLFAQQKKGLIKSGSYCTSSSNSRIRVMLSRLIGAKWCIAMGDDSIEQYIEGAAEKYAQLGLNIKFYKRTSKESFEFCSMQFEEDKAIPLNWTKTLFRLLCNNPSDEFETQFRQEMRNSPELQRCLGSLTSSGWIGGKNKLQNESNKTIEEGYSQS